MLKIKRKRGESFIVGEAKIRIEMIGSQTVHLSVDAPRSVPISRFELIKPDNIKGDSGSTLKPGLQARLEGATKWTDYGSIPGHDAAKQEAIKAAIDSLTDYEWIVEVRVKIDDNDTTQAWKVRVKTFVAAEIVGEVYE